MIQDRIVTVNKDANGKRYTASVNIKATWDEAMKELAIQKANNELERKIEEDSKELEEQQKSKENLSESDKEDLLKARGLIDKLLGIDASIPTNNSAQEAMLDGTTKISWFERVTPWKRVLNAARRTIGKSPVDKDPSDSWKAKILLAEHSPIRLLEFDWGWEKIRQWVSVHLVRHHEGCEKFVHSQRGDRRELPCDRDHIYQGAKNDMDMTANAQALINMSRKRCCNCASKETREAWKMVLAELEEIDPILRSKCVPECVYRGFCPEWMSKCGFKYTKGYKKLRAEYVNTRYGKDVRYFYDNEYDIIVSDTGHIYNARKILDKSFSRYIDYVDIVENNILCGEADYEAKFSNGRYVVIAKVDTNYGDACNIIVDETVVRSFKLYGGKMVSTNNIYHLDGNEWNNAFENLKVMEVISYE